MFFLSPHFLWLMLALPLLPVLYLWLLQRRAKLVVRYSSLATGRHSRRDSRERVLCKWPVLLGQPVEAEIDQ
ncbi:MAG TPA: BatA domain-containing protein [Polaromonas sp.]|uniref:BatA domain-containing protein n=1 Tax=Polaromonas sp. TaxID=1869339 RepID=UPI002D72F919|nr:BatA domain-containing protein [Polaromonas sp.]HYW55453.1 BatA domain-containing protein [Polaromonas sp.]